MNIVRSKEKYFIYALAIIELMLVCTGRTRFLGLFLIGNIIGPGIRCNSLTTKFVNSLRSKNYLLYKKHQWAMDSGNMLTIKWALRNETLSEEERNEIKNALKYVYFLFLWNFILIISLIIRFRN